MAKLGFGTLFKVFTGGVYATIGEQVKIKPPQIKVDTVDVTNEQSPNAAREFIAGLVDYGEVSLELNYAPGGAAEATLLGLLRQVIVCRIVYPDGSRADFSAILTGVGPDAPLDKQLAASVSLKITGVVVMTAAAPPANSVLPAMGGLLTQGTTLTAWEGVWTGEPTSFAYQWTKDTVNINGATAKTYLIAAGDATHVLAVIVTGTNSAGSASATSAPSKAVV